MAAITRWDVSEGLNIWQWFLTFDSVKNFKVDRIMEANGMESHNAIQNLNTSAIVIFWATIVLIYCIIKAIYKYDSSNIELN